MILLAEKLQLPCGAEIKNRFGKSAMSEILGSPTNGPTQALVKAYDRWAKGECGLLISGNVMIDRQALGEPKNVVLEDEKDFKLLSQWAKSGSQNGTHFWMQLNHPGKQSPSFLSPTPVAPSSVPLSGALSLAFKLPRELTDQEIWDIVHRFGRSAEIAKRAGWSGIQIHGAHGYLVSQFLSPYHNRRSDFWGGALENRMRFVIEVYKSIRAKVGNSFPVSIKLNSSDFQKGGFDESDSLKVIKALSKAGIDLIEISGGNYEKPAMMGASHSREGYFQEFCKAARKAVSTPLMLTGGFRSAQGMENALRQGICDLIGLARPLTLDPDLPKKILAGDLSYSAPMKNLTTGFKFLDQLSMLNITWYEAQIALLGKGREPNPELSALGSVWATFSGLGLAAFRKRRT